MSRSVDLFIDMEPPIESVVGRIASITGVDPGPGEMPGTWSIQRDGVRAELHAHPYIDDGDLLFSRYRWALSCRLDSAVPMTDSAETALLRVVAESLRSEGVATLLVHDLQYLDRQAAASAPEVGDDPNGARS